MKVLSGSLFSSCQQGAALIVGIVFLLILTMIGISAIQTSTLEERMAGNIRDTTVATQAAEMALRQGESQISQRTEQTGNGYYDAETGAAPDPLTNEWSTANARALTGITFTNMKVYSAPLLFIEKQPNTALSNLNMKTVQKKEVEPFYVTARSTGGSGTANVTLQSAYRRLK